MAITVKPTRLINTYFVGVVGKTTSPPWRKTINPDTETVMLAPDCPSWTPSSVADLMSAMSTSEPRFTFYRFAHTHNGQELSPVLFVYTCPTVPNRSIKHRMMYALMKKAVLSAAENAGLKVEKKFEVDDPSELTEQTVLDDLHPKAIARQGFARPKRPGR